MKRIAGRRVGGLGGGCGVGVGWGAGVGGAGGWGWSGGGLGVASMPASRRWAGVMGVGAPVSGSRPEAALGKAITSRMLAAAGEQHDHPVPAERDAAVRRRAVLERVEQEAELGAGLLRRTGRSRRTPPAASRTSGYGSSRRRSRSRCSTMSYASASAPPGSAANLSAHSGSGAVNGWCTEVQPPSPSSSNMGASTTHRNDQADCVDQAAAAGRSPAGPRRAARGRPGAGPAAKNTQSPGPAPVAAARPGPLGLGQVLGDRPGPTPRRPAPIST